MAYARCCPFCGAYLDPCEICDCQTEEKETAAPRDATSGGFSIPFCSRWLRPEAGYRLFISVQPFTDVIGDYTCHNRDNKR